MPGRTGNSPPGNAGPPRRAVIRGRLEVAAASTQSARRGTDAMGAAARIRRRCLPSAGWLGCALCPLLGVAWILLFPAVTITTGERRTRGSFFDENALMVRNQAARSAHGAYGLTPRGRDAGRGDSGEPPLARIAGLLRRSGLDARWGPSGVLYGRLGASPGGGEEDATLIVLPYASGAAPGVVYRNAKDVISVLHAASKAGWRAKPIIYVFEEVGAGGRGEERGAGRAPRPGAQGRSVAVDWLLPVGRGGPAAGADRPPWQVGKLRTGLVLRVLDCDTVARYRLLSIGANGAQPNLDLVFLVSHVLAQGGRYGLDECLAPGCRDLASRAAARLAEALTRAILQCRVFEVGAVRRYGARLRGLLLYGLALAGGAPGDHEALLRRNIDAVTVVAEGPGGTAREDAAREDAANRAALLRALDLFLRSSNNLEEDLHHATSKYLLPSPAHFVSASEYGASLGLLALPLGASGLRGLLRARDASGAPADALLLAAAVLCGAVAAAAAPQSEPWPWLAAVLSGWAALLAAANGTVGGGGGRGACARRRSVALVALCVGHAVLGVVNYALAVVLLALAAPGLLAAAGFSAAGRPGAAALVAAAWDPAVLLALLYPAPGRQVLGWWEQHARGGGCLLLLHWLCLSLPCRALLAAGLRPSGPPAPPPVVPGVQSLNAARMQT